MNALLSLKRPTKRPLRSLKFTAMSVVITKHLSLTSVKIFSLSTRSLWAGSLWWKRTRWHITQPQASAENPRPYKTDKTMPFNPDIHHRHSIRLKDYDYSQAGAYFITICALQRECLFGDITDGEMRLNELGLVIMDEWNLTP